MSKGRREHVQEGYVQVSMSEGTFTGICLRAYVQGDMKKRIGVGPREYVERSMFGVKSKGVGICSKGYAKKYVRVMSTWVVQGNIIEVCQRVVGSMSKRDMSK